jgi:hypothetical protein
MSDVLMFVAAGGGHRHGGALGNATPARESLCGRSHSRLQEDTGWFGARADKKKDVHRADGWLGEHGS